MIHTQSQVYIFNYSILYRDEVGIKKCTERVKDKLYVCIIIINQDWYFISMNEWMMMKYTIFNIKTLISYKER